MLKFLYKNIKVDDDQEFKIGTELNDTIIKNIIEKKVKYYTLQ